MSHQASLHYDPALNLDQTMKMTEKSLMVFQEDEAHVQLIILISFIHPHPYFHGYGSP